jgi:hypothetical protein
MDKIEFRKAYIDYMRMFDVTDAFENEIRRDIFIDEVCQSLYADRPCYNALMLIECLADLRTYREFTNNHMEMFFALTFAIKAGAICENTMKPAQQCRDYLYKYTEMFESGIINTYSLFDTQSNDALLFKDILNTSYSDMIYHKNLYNELYINHSMDYRFTSSNIPDWGIGYNREIIDTRLEIVKKLTRSGNVFNNAFIRLEHEAGAVKRLKQEYNYLVWCKEILKNDE